jgi:hypothetical protein
MRYALVLLAALMGLGGMSAPAQGVFNFNALFPEDTHSFGTVARGSKLHHTFRLVNTTSQDVHIADWRTKCGCSEVKVGARDIPPGTQTTIEVTLDTTKFVGYKPSGLTLVFDRPTFGEKDLKLDCFIRSDVMLNPGGFDFGVIPRGSERSLTLNLSYYGSRPDWKITGLTTLSDDVTAQLRPLGHSSSGAAQFQLTATVRSTAPAGYLRDEITLQTNDPDSPRIPVSLTAQVQPAVTVAPAVLNLGRLRAGQTVKKTVLVKSTQPFKLTGATSAREELKALGNIGESKPFHTLTVTFTAPAQLGPFNATLEIATDLKDESPAKLSVFATIVP